VHWSSKPQASSSSSSMHCSVQLSWMRRMLLATAVTRGWCTVQAAVGSLYCLSVCLFIPTHQGRASARLSILRRNRAAAAASRVQLRRVCLGWGVDGDSEKFRVPPSMLKRTIRMRDEGEWSGVGGTCVARHCKGGSVAEWLACWTQAQKGPGSNRSRDAVG